MLPMFRYENPCGVNWIVASHRISRDIFKSVRDEITLSVRRPLCRITQLNLHVALTLKCIGKTSSINMAFYGDASHDVMVSITQS